MNKPLLFSKNIFVLLAFIITGLLANAQNYRSFYPGIKNYFHAYPGFNPAAGVGSTISAPVYVLRSDSLSVQGSDTTYYTLRNFRKETLPANCYDPIDTGIAGGKVHILSNGNDIFFNQDGDSIKIFAGAQPSQTFALYTFPNGDYYEGTMTGYSFTFLPIGGDSIKIFSFQRKNSSGTPVADPFNALEVYNSKNYGVIQTYDWLRFPYEISTYQLAGSADAGTGIDNLTASEIFDFNVGDNFQHHQPQPFFIGPGTYYQKIWVERTVLSKTYSINSDTVTYSYDEKRLVESYTVTPSNMNAVYTHDTVSEYIRLSGNLLNEYSLKFGQDIGFSFSNNPWYGNGPDGYNVQHNPATYNNRELKTKYSDFSYSSGCAYELLTNCYSAFDFGEGIGFINKQASSFGSCQPVNMVYYSKGTETWGTPIDWSTLLLDEHGSYDFGLRVYPNPANNELNFSFSKLFDGKVSIFDAAGKKVLDKEFTGNNEKVLLENFADGFYFYQLNSPNGIIKTGKFVKE
jgi:hypothetical protein